MQRWIKRGYASVATLGVTRQGHQVATAPQVAQATSTVQSSVVRTVDHKGPVSSLHVVLPLGSRVDRLPGTAHFLKAVLLRDLLDDSLVRVVREAELRGNAISTKVDREHLYLSASFLRDDLVDVAPLLLSMIYNPLFAPHEFSDKIDNLLTESKVNLADSSTKAWELLHSLAFRGGLGSPLYLSANSVGEFTRKILTDQLSSQPVSIVATGVDHQDLLSLVTPLIQEKPSSQSVESEEFFGGEIRVDNGVKSSATVLLGLKSVGTDSPLFPASLVLEQLLGGSPVTPYGTPRGLLGQLSGTSKITAELKSYKGAGILGVKVSGKTADVKGALEAAFGVLKNMRDVDVQKGIKKVKVALELNWEAEVDGLVKHGKSVKELSKLVDAVTKDDVLKVVKEAVDGKKCLVSIGERELPYLDQLKF